MEQKETAMTLTTFGTEIPDSLADGVLCLPLGLQQSLKDAIRERFYHSCPWVHFIDPNPTNPPNN